MLEFTQPCAQLTAGYIVAARRYRDLFRIAPEIERPRLQPTPTESRFSGDRIWWFQMASRMLITLKFIWPISLRTPAARSCQQAAPVTFFAYCA